MKKEPVKIAVKKKPLAPDVKKEWQSALEIPNKDELSSWISHQNNFNACMVFFLAVETIVLVALAGKVLNWY